MSWFEGQSFQVSIPALTLLSGEYGRWRRPASGRGDRVKLLPNVGSWYFEIDRVCVDDRTGDEEMPDQVMILNLRTYDYEGKEVSMTLRYHAEDLINASLCYAARTFQELVYFDNLSRAHKNSLNQSILFSQVLADGYDWNADDPDFYYVSIERERHKVRVYPFRFDVALHGSPDPVVLVKLIPGEQDMESFCVFLPFLDYLQLMQDFAYFKNLVKVRVVEGDVCDTLVTNVGDISNEALIQPCCEVELNTYTAPKSQ